MRLALGGHGTHDLTAANGSDFNPFHLALAACPFFPGTSGHKIKSHILKVPNSVIILASQSTCNWPIKLLRKKKIGSFTQVNTEILTVTVQRWRGQASIPILEMRKWRKR